MYAEAATITANTTIERPRSNPKASSRCTFKWNISNDPQRHVIKLGRDIPIRISRLNNYQMLRSGLDNMFKYGESTCYQFLYSGITASYLKN